MKTKKKILIDARCIGGEGQGMLTYIVGLYNAFHNQYNKEYELFIAGYEYNSVKKEFTWLEKENFIQLSNRSKWWLYIIEFPKVIRKYQIDYAHFQYMVPFVKNCKFIVTTHDVLFLDFPKEFSFSYRIKRKVLFYLSLIRSDIKLTVSDYSRKRMAYHFDLDPSKISITRNAVNDNFFKPYEQNVIRKELKKTFGINNYLLYVSRIEHRKNQLQLLNEYKSLNLADSNIHLVLVGNNTLQDANLSQKIKETITQYPGKVHWLKGLSNAELLKIYQGARLFIYPSKAEGFGIPPIEAAGLGINTICAKNTAMEDFTFLGNNLYPDNQPQALTNAIIKNLNNPPTPTQLKMISTHIKTEYSWEKSALIVHKEIQQSQGICSKIVANEIQFKTKKLESLPKTA